MEFSCTRKLRGWSSCVKGTIKCSFLVQRVVPPVRFTSWPWTSQVWPTGNILRIIDFAYSNSVKRKWKTMITDCVLNVFVWWINIKIFPLLKTRNAKTFLVWIILMSGTDADWLLLDFAIPNKNDCWNWEILSFGYQKCRFLFWRKINFNT